MARNDVDDYLDELETIEGSGGSQADVAARLKERARQSPPGSPEQGGFLNAAGDHWGYAGDSVRAEASYRASIASGGDTHRYSEAALVLLLLEDGRDQEADSLVADLLRSARAGELDAETYEMVADALEEGGRPREALRWYTMPLRNVDPEDLDHTDLVLLAGRRRVREALGMGRDGFDLALERLRDEPAG